MAKIDRRWDFDGDYFSFDTLVSIGQLDKEWSEKSIGEKELILLVPIEQRDTGEKEEENKQFILFFTSTNQMLTQYITILYIYAS